MNIWIWVIIIVVAGVGYYLWKQVQGANQMVDEIVESGSLFEDASADMAYQFGAGAMKQGNTDAAISAFKRADELGHENATHNLGVLLEKAGRLDEARQVFARSVDRGFIPHAGNLAIILRKQGEYEEALKMIQMARDADVGDPGGIMDRIESDIRAEMAQPDQV